MSRTRCNDDDSRYHAGRGRHHSGAGANRKRRRHRCRRTVQLPGQAWRWTAPETSTSLTRERTIRKITPPASSPRWPGRRGQPAAEERARPHGSESDRNRGRRRGHRLRGGLRITRRSARSRRPGSHHTGGGPQGQHRRHRCRGTIQNADRGRGRTAPATSMSRTSRTTRSWEVSNPTVVVQGGVMGTSPVAVSAPLTGLQPGTTYTSRAVATDPVGTAVGAILSFTTTTGTAVTTITLLGPLQTHRYWARRSPSRPP